QLHDRDAVRSGTDELRFVHEKGKRQRITPAFSREPGDLARRCARPKNGETIFSWMSCDELLGDACACVTLRNVPIVTQASGAIACRMLKTPATSCSLIAEPVGRTMTRSATSFVFGNMSPACG